MDFGGLHLAKQAKSAAGEAHGICSSSGYSGKGFGLKYESFTLILDKFASTTYRGHLLVDVVILGVLS